MRIELTKIKASENPIRKTWDEESINNLKWSLMEEGQVEPVGVHENHNGYVLVWGHRRTEAARRAGWNEIEAMVVPENEVSNLIQAGIENLASEDMSITEKSEWAFRLTELGLSQGEISRRSTVPQQTISTWLTYKREKEDGVTSASHTRSDDEGIEKVLRVARVLGDDVTAKNKVLQKSSNESLGQVLTKTVAQAYKQAATPEIKAAVIETPIMKNDTQDSIIKRATESVRQQGIAFSWFLNINYTNMVDSHKLILMGIETLNAAKIDVGTARLLLKQEKDYLLTYVKRIDEILGGQNE